jgi:hypothetical protein
MYDYLRLELKRTLRDRRYLIMTIAMPVALYCCSATSSGTSRPPMG